MQGIRFMKASMKNVDTKKIRKAMEKVQDENRYEHTLGVTYTATALAMCYHCDLHSAEIAGLLHDCAKCMDNAKKIQICEKHNIPVNEVERKILLFYTRKQVVLSPWILMALLIPTSLTPF